MINQILSDSCPITDPVIAPNIGHKTGHKTGHETGYEKGRLTRSVVFLRAICVMSVLVAMPAWAQQSPVDAWAMGLNPMYFKGIDIIEDDTVFEMDTPYRAEDAALTPVSIHAKIPQTQDRYIKTIYMFVDENPQPVVGIFHMTPEMGRADLAMRIRISQYTWVRAVAVLNTGEHYMVANFVKAQGGCSAPLGADYKRAMEKIGRMKFRTVGELSTDQAIVGQLLVSHPNITGMQKDQKTQLFRPAHYVKTLKVSYKGDLVLRAEVGFAISVDPSFRFFFKPHDGGTLTAEVTDSKGMSWTETFDVGL